MLLQRFSFGMKTRAGWYLMTAQLHTSQTKIDRRMTLSHCFGVNRPARQLVVLMSWMLAKDRHVDKYRQMYFNRGFDILTVRSSPTDLLIPPTGMKVSARNMINFLEKKAIVTYPDIVIHAFSVGAYLWAELLVELHRTRTQEQIQNGIQKHLRGAIFDSIVHVDECAPGLSRAITKAPIIQPAMQLAINWYLHKSLANKYYRAAEPYFHGHYLPCNRMILSSATDNVSDPGMNAKTRDDWAGHGMHVQWKCWPESAHVLHYHTHPKEYEDEVDKFLGRSRFKLQPVEIGSPVQDAIGSVDLYKTVGLEAF